MLNFKKLRADINQTTIELRETKALFRESGQPNLRPDRWEIDPNTRMVRVVEQGSRTKLNVLKTKATVLCSIRAHHRGKLHIQRRATPNPAGGPPIYVPTDLAWQEKMIATAGPNSKEPWLADYTLPDPTPEEIERLKDAARQRRLVGMCPTMELPAKMVG